MEIESFAVYRSLGRSLWSIIVFSTFIQVLLSFIVSTENSHLILKGFLLSITLSFYLADFNILSSLCELVIMLWANKLFWPYLFGVLYSFCTVIVMYFFRLEIFFLPMIMLNIIFVPLNWDSSPSSISIFLRFIFS